MRHCKIIETFICLLRSAYFVSINQAATRYKCLQNAIKLGSFYGSVIGLLQYRSTSITTGVLILILETDSIFKIPILIQETFLCSSRCFLDILLPGGIASTTYIILSVSNLTKSLMSAQLLKSLSH